MNTFRQTFNNLSSWPRGSENKILVGKPTLSNPVLSVMPGISRKLPSIVLPKTFRFVLANSASSSCSGRIFGAVIRTVGNAKTAPSSSVSICFISSLLPLCNANKSAAGADGWRVSELKVLAHAFVGPIGSSTEYD